MPNANIPTTVEETPRADARLTQLVVLRSAVEEEDLAEVGVLLARARRAYPHGEGDGSIDPEIWAVASDWLNTRAAYEEANDAFEKALAERFE